MEAPGFKKTVRSNLTLAMRGQLQIDIRLEVGGLNESITISAESPILDTSTVTRGKALTTREIMDLPVMTNDIVLMARLAPGVVNQGTTQFLTQGMVGGGSGFFAPLVPWPERVDHRRRAESRQRRDCVHALHRPDRRVQDRHDQFRRLCWTFHRAEYRLFDQVRHQQPARLGTEQYWNTRWNAASFFVKQKYFQNIAAANAAGNNALASQLRSQPMQPGGHSNDYGFTLGGPVYIPKVINGKNKLFWFFSYSGNKTRQPARSSEITNTVPTMPQRTGNFSDLLAINSKYQIYDPLSVAPDPARRRALYPDAHSGEHYSPKQNSRPKIFNWYTSRLPTPTTVRPIRCAEPFNNFLALGQVDNVNYTGMAGRGD